MAFFYSALLYTALALGANAAMADTAGLEALKSGDMKKLVFASEPAVVPDTVIYDVEDAEHRLSDYRGRVVLVNFWATWCAPCRKEMPSLDRLQGAMGGEDFVVVTIATGRNPIPAMQKFFTENGVANLPLLRDPKQALARDMARAGPAGKPAAGPRGARDRPPDRRRGMGHSRGAGPDRRGHRRGGLKPRHPVMAGAGDQMVVEKPAGLHEGINDGRSDKAEPGLGQVL